MTNNKDIMNSTTDKTHDFLAEELLIPNVNKSSANRINMFCSNIMQAVVLKEGQCPRVFSNFENQIGEISHAYRKLDQDCEVVEIVSRDEQSFNKDILVKRADGVLDVINIRDSHNITEEYGFVYHDMIPNVRKGDTLKAGTVVYRSSSYDEELNLTYGTNIKAIYYPMKGITYEDGIVISESAAKKLTHYTISEVVVSINTNDILLNLYGDENHYKCLPEIGQYTKNGVICARRRLDYSTMLRNMTNESLSEIDSPDTCFYSRGQVVDIEVFCNNDKDILAKNEYNSQILSFLADQEISQEQLLEKINFFLDQGLELSDDLSYQYARIKDMLTTGKRYIINGSSFDNLVVKVKIKEEHPAKIGSKITNR